jgi:hypothetical protein
MKYTEWMKCKVIFMNVENQIVSDDVTLIILKKPILS